MGVQPLLRAACGSAPLNSPVRVYGAHRLRPGAFSACRVAGGALESVDCLMCFVAAFAVTGIKIIKESREKQRKNRYNSAASGFGRSICGACRSLRLLRPVELVRPGRTGLVRIRKIPVLKAGRKSSRQIFRRNRQLPSCRGLRVKAGRHREIQLHRQRRPHDRYHRRGIRTDQLQRQAAHPHLQHCAVTPRER